MSKDWQSQAHVKWDCKYHVVILPKYRKKALFGKLRRQIGAILRDLCRQKDIELVEGKAMPDHIHMLLSVPPRFITSWKCCPFATFAEPWNIMCSNKWANPERPRSSFRKPTL